jgi:hypothetical protein
MGGETAHTFGCHALAGSYWQAVDDPDVDARLHTGGPPPPFGGGKQPSNARRSGLLAKGSSATAKQTAAWATKGLEPPAEAGIAVAPKAKAPINGAAKTVLKNLPRREGVSF